MLLLPFAASNKTLVKMGAADLIHCVLKTTNICLLGRF